MGKRKCVWCNKQEAMGSSYLERFCSKKCISEAREHDLKSHKEIDESYVDSEALFSRNRKLEILEDLKRKAELEKDQEKIKEIEEILNDLKNAGVDGTGEDDEVEEEGIKAAEIQATEQLIMDDVRDVREDVQAKHTDWGEEERLKKEEEERLKKEEEDKMDEEEEEERLRIKAKKLGITVDGVRKKESASLGMQSCLGFIVFIVIVYFLFVWWFGFHLF